MKDKKRKEVWLSLEVINRLQTIADKKGWSLKQYMENILSTRGIKAKSKS